MIRLAAAAALLIALLVPACADDEPLTPGTDPRACPTEKEGRLIGCVCDDGAQGIGTCTGGIVEVCRCAADAAADAPRD